MTKLLALIAPVLLILAQSGSLHASSIKDLPVTSIQYEPTTKRLSIKVVNEGPEIITAFGLNVDVQVDEARHYTVGSVEDVLNVVISNRLTKRDPTSWIGAIQPGGVYTNTIQLNLEDGVVPRFRATVTGIVYSSGNTVATDPQTVQTILNLRQSSMRSIEAIQHVVQDAGVNGRVLDRVDSIQDSLRALHDRAENEQNSANALNPLIIELAIGDFENIRRSSDSDGQFQMFMQNLQFRHEHLKPHLTISQESQTK